MYRSPDATDRYSSWPRRSSPILSGSPFSAPTRRRQKTDAPGPATVDSRDACGSSARGSATAPAARGPDPGSGGLESPAAALQARRQKRTEDDLARQLALREREISDCMRQVDALQTALDDAERCVQAEKQEQLRVSMHLGWYEGQLSKHRREASQREKAHCLALQRAEEQSRLALQRAQEQSRLALQQAQDQGRDKASWLQARLCDREKEVDRLAARAAALARQLAAAQSGEEAARSSAAAARAASCSLARELEEARRAAAQASEAAAELRRALNERSACAAEPEPPADPSLFAEIAKATGSSSSGGGPQYRAAPLPPRPKCAAVRTGRAASGAACAPGLVPRQGPLFWLAVCAHMAAALCLRICVLPVLRIVLRIAAGLVSLAGLAGPAALLRTHLCLLLSRIAAALQ